MNGISLKPLQQLQPAGAPQSWIATGYDPQFLLTCELPRGWIELTLELGAGDSRAELFWDTGSGFNARECLALQPGTRLCHLPRPVRAIRFDPVSMPGAFTLRRFEIRPRSTLHVVRRAVMFWLARAQRDRAIFKELAAALKAAPSKTKLMLLSQPGLVSAWSSPAAAPEPEAASYARWIAAHPLDEHGIRAALTKWQDPPLISVLMPVFNPPAQFLQAAIASVRAQLYPHWELCVADDASTLPHVREILSAAAGADSRIKVIFRPQNGNVCAASNAALTLCTGSFVALLDHDDELTPDALFHVAQSIRADPGLGMLYSDEDKLDPAGVRCAPYFKPGWSPEHALATVYTGHLAVFRAEFLRASGAFRLGFEYAQDQDLVLRVLAAAVRVAHIPRVLYHWRMLPGSAAADPTAKPSGHEAGRRALETHLREASREGTVESDYPNIFRVRYRLAGAPKVSILIPTAHQCDATGVPFIERCLRSIREQSTYLNYEILLAVGPQPSCLPLPLPLSSNPPLQVTIPGPFNWSRANNLLAARATGEHLLFLNDDTEVRNPDWLEALLEFSQQPEIGAVGAKLFFPNGTLQHIGVNFIRNGPDHPFAGYPGTHAGYFGSALLHRNYAAVTGACLMTRRDTFASVGGFSEDFDLDYGDVDFCLKLRAGNQRVVFTPHAQLIHHQSATRKPGHNHDAALALLLKKWGPLADPYHNPNLSPDSNACHLP